MWLTVSSVSHYVSDSLLALGKQGQQSLQALRESMIWLIPCLMTSSFFLFAASMGEFILGERRPWIELCYSINAVVVELFPFLLTSTLSYVLAMQWKLARPPVILLSLVCLASVQSVSLGESSGITHHIVLAIITPLYATPLLAHLLRFSSLRLAKTEAGGKIVKESLNLILPSLLTVSTVLLMNHTLFVTLGQIQLFDYQGLDYANEPYQFGFTFAALNSLFWFVGIHGYYALLPLVDMLQEASQLNYSTALAGGISPYLMDLPFMGVFVFIGGSGATLSLVVAILLYSKHQPLRLLAIASIPIGLFNVNEILLFGLPIIFNPRLFIPFLLVPIVNVFVGLTVISQGYVDAPSFPVPFNSPVLINAWIATDGDTGAVLLQLLNIGIGALLYFPALRSLEKTYANRTIRLPSLDTTYQRLQESASVEQEDTVSLSQLKTSLQSDVEHHVEALSHSEFCLQYQPQISSTSGRMVGAEALVRAIDRDGNISSPLNFLPWLEHANLTKDLDLWVFRQATQDISQWKQEGMDLPISINICPATLIDPLYIDQITELIAPIASSIHIEITEQSLLEDETALKTALQQFHSLGVSVYIDDFGTGYSSLSYLNHFDIDAIKIDRDFVLALTSVRGRKVFESLFNIASTLNLDVVVEGVETQEQMKNIPKLDSVCIQGWYYSKSLTFSQFNQYFQQTNLAGAHVFK